MGLYENAVASGGVVLLILLFILAFSGITNAVELQQHQLIPPYKSISRFNVTLDITNDQVFNTITATTSTHYYIFRVHNDRATALNLSGITKQFFMHLVTAGTTSNYKFYQYEGYRQETLPDGNITYFTSWSEIPFTDVLIPAGQTKIYGVGFDINNPFASGDYNISFTLAGQEYLLDPAITACGTLSADTYYTMATAGITNGASGCIVVGGNNITLDLNGSTLDGAGGTGIAYTVGNGIGSNLTVMNGTIKDWFYAFLFVENQSDMTFKNLNVYNISGIGWYIYGSTTNSLSKNITFQNVNFTAQQGYASAGVMLYGYGSYENVTINCNSTTGTTSGIDIFPYYGTVAYMVSTLKNVTIKNCVQGITLGSRNNAIVNVTATNTSVINSTGYDISTLTYAGWDNNVTYNVQGITFSGGNATVHFIEGSEQTNTTIVLLNITGWSNSTIKNVFGLSTTNQSVFLKNFVRFNFTTDTGQGQSSNFQINNTNNGVILNATADVNGFSNWIILNNTQYFYNSNTSYNPYTLNAHPSSVGYNMNASILSFTNTGTWNITFYSGTSPDPAPTVGSVTLCNGTACGALGTLYYHSNALNASAVCTDSNTTAIQIKFRYYRNGSLYNEYITYNRPFNTTVYANTTVPSTAIIKSDTWTVGANCYDGAQWSGETVSSGFTVNNTAPTTSTPTLNNTAPKTTSVLLCTVGGYSDADTDTAGTIYYRWWKNGAVVGGQTASTLDLSAIAAAGGDKINCSGNQSDTGYSAFNSTEKFSTQAVVQTTPFISTVNLTYQNTSAIVTLYTQQGLNCSFTVLDNDSATTNVTVRWYDSIDGIVGSHTVSNVANNTLTWATQAFGAVPSQLYKGRNYYCSVSATDGAYTTGYSASTQYTVNNTAPTIGAPILSPAALTNTTVATCTNYTYYDIDGDTKGLGRWRWFKNNVLVSGNTTQNVSMGPAGLNTSDGDIVICEYKTEDSGYDLRNSTAQNSTPQTIGAVGVPSISLCTSGFPVLNFTLWDEETLTSVTGSMEATFTLYNTSDQSVISNASFIITNSSYFAFCINQYAITVYVDSFQAYYTSLALGEYDQRQYFLLKAFLDASAPQTIPIYLENATYSKQTQIFVRDETGKGLRGIYLAIQRYYAGTNDYKVVAMSKTNDQGYAVTYLRPNDPYYRIIAYQQSGAVIQAFTSAFIPCDPGLTTCTLNLQVTPQVFGYYWNYYGKVAHNCTTLNASGVYSIMCSFIDTSGLSKNVSLVVKKIGAPTTTICTNVSYSQSGVLICYLPDPAAKYTYYLTMDINPIVLLESGDIGFIETLVFGTFGLFIAMFLVFTLAFAGLWLGSPPVAVAFALIGVIFAWVSELMVIGITAMASIIVLGVFIIYLSRRS